MEGSFGNQLKTLRGRVKHLTQSDVARRLNVSVASVNYWENDFNKPNMRNLKSLIALLFVEGAFTTCIGYLGHPFAKLTIRSFITPYFSLSCGTLP
jgi:transcriptional regulator with XRE-family HTH domain